LSAPSGTGKTTVCRQVVAADPGIVLSVSHTTRAPRGAERDGADYHFVSVERFRELVSEDAFLEYAQYGTHLYGTSWSALETPRARGLDVLLEIEIQGARQVRDRLAEACLVFLLPPSLRELERRLRGRGTDDEATIQRRLTIARQELDAAPLYDYAIVNDDLDRAVHGVAEVIAGERSGDTADLRRRFAPGPARERLLAREHGDHG
jgi:guanylate kinase